jgi:dihydroneopterin aldolase
MNGVIILEGLEFFAYHGVSDAERQTGNKYIVDIKIISDTNRFLLDKLITETKTDLSFSFRPLLNPVLY